MAIEMLSNCTVVTVTPPHELKINDCTLAIGEFYAV